MNFFNKYLRSLTYEAQKSTYKREREQFEHKSKELFGFPKRPILNTTIIQEGDFEKLQRQTFFVHHCKG